jgi:membrane associated rhomboid family serine protease
MKGTLAALRSSLTPGVATLLALQVAVGLAQAVGHLLSAWNLSPWLALSGPAFWHGRLWQIVTYVLALESLMEFLTGALFLFFLGPRIERTWSRGQFWSFCLLVVAGAGLIKVLLQPASPFPMTGAAPLGWGLLAASVRLFGNERINLLGFGETTLRHAALWLAGLSFVLSLLGGGLIPALLAMSGGVVGWVYLSLRWRANRFQAPQATRSERMGKLEW